MGIIGQVSAQLIDVLLIVSFITVLTLFIVTGRHRHIAIGEISDDTGLDELRGLMASASSEFRFCVCAQMEIVRNMDTDYQKVVQHAADLSSAENNPSMKAAIIP